jgi:hypothetical protein
LSLPETPGQLIALFGGFKYIGDDEIDQLQDGCENNPNLSRESRLKCATYRYSSPYGYRKILYFKDTSQSPNL